MSDFFNFLIPFAGALISISSAVLACCLAYVQQERHRNIVVAVSVLGISAICILEYARWEKVKYERTRAEDLTAKIERMEAAQAKRTHDLKVELFRALKALEKDPSERAPDEIAAVNLFFGSRSPQTPDLVLIGSNRQDCAAEVEEVLADFTSESFQPMLSLLEERVDAIGRRASERFEGTGRLTEEHLKESANRVIRRWKEDVGGLFNSVGEIEESMKGVASRLQNTEDRLVEVSVDLLGFRHELMAEPSKAGDDEGLLIRLDQEIDRVEERLDLLASVESGNKKFRRCLAQRPWPFTLACPSRLDEKDDETPGPENSPESTLQQRAAIAPEPSSISPPGSAHDDQGISAGISTGSSSFP